MLVRKLDALTRAGSRLTVVGTAFWLAQIPIASGQEMPTAQKKEAAQAKNHKFTENERIVHVLNRLGFGPRPSDIDTVKKIGLKRYIEQQLSPENVDDSAVDTKLKNFPDLQLPDYEIEGKYNDFIVADQEAAKMRRDLQKMQAQAAQMQSGQPMDTTTGTATTTPPPAQGQTKREAVRDMVLQNPDLLKQVEDTRKELEVDATPIALIHEEFMASKLIRAVESQRQLQEVLVDFWGNHFNIDERKAPCGILKVLDDRDAIRPHVFGKFRDLLEATAKSPAMLVYLDNFQSVSDTLPIPVRPRRQGRFALLNQNAMPATPPKRKIGLNENYGRELMELHTLGVNGGYTQQDVHEVARCFTGWGLGFTDGARPKVNRYGHAGEFEFHPRLHDDGEKVVLGHHIPAGGGMKDGEIVLDMLANDPATRKHISYELCQRLVCDDPPYSLVSKCIETWQHTDGDLREVVRTIVTSPEFFSNVAISKKIKSPFEFAVSSVRALDGTLDTDTLISQKQLPREANQMVRPPQGGGFIDLNTNTLLGQIGTMGEPLFQYQAPTGYPEDSRKWVSSGALISRLNFALALTQGKIKDVHLGNLAEDAGPSDDPNAMIDSMALRILHGNLSPATRSTLIAESSDASTKKAMGSALTPAQVAALLLGSPEFQRR